MNRENSGRDGKQNGMNARLMRWARGLGAALFWLALWYVLARAVGQELLLASPAAVLSRLADMVVQSDFWLYTGLTMLRIMAGFLLAVAAGTLLAVLTTRFRLIDTLMQPLLGMVKATPVASFILLALIWMHSGVVPMFCTFIMVLPVVWANVCAGIANTDPQLLEMAKAYGFSAGYRLKYIYIPSVMPYFIAAFTTGLGMGWKAGIAAEVLCRPEKSIGIQMYYSKIYLETADLFAWTAVVIVISMLLEKLFVAAGKRAGRRYNAG